MADISHRITRKSLKAKKKDAIRMIKQQAKEKIKEIKLEYSKDPNLKASKQKDREEKKEERAEKANARIAYNARRSHEYTLGEDLFNSISHGIGACLAVAILVLLVIKAAVSNVDNKAVLVTSYALYASFLFLLFLMSTLYHALLNTTARKVFSVITRISTFLWMAGNYTPYLLTQCTDAPRWVIFIIIWALAVFFSIMYSTLQTRMNGLAEFIYFGAGITLAVLIILNKTLPMNVKIFYYAACASFALASIFFKMRKIKGAHGVFHLFTIAGSVLQFFALFFAI